MSNYSEHLAFAVTLAEQAGKIIQSNFSSNIDKEWKSDNTPVTKADLEINQLVIDEVAKRFPDHAVLAEEGNSKHQGSEYVWVCDPIDGTFPFVHGIPTSVFSLALVKDGEPVLGVVEDPCLQRRYSAEKGKGTHLNGKPIKVSNQKKLERVALGIEWWNEAPFTFADLIRKLSEQPITFYMLHSTVYMGMQVARGAFVANIFPGSKPHDFAAQKILVEEAGGKCTDLFGNPLRYNQESSTGFLATNGLLHDEILELIRETVKK